MLRSFSTIIFCFIIFTSFGQQAYTWDDYGISFSLSDDFKETANTGEEFAAVGDGMEMSIIPFADETIDDKDITTYTMSIAASLNLTRIDVRSMRSRSMVSKAVMQKVYLKVSKSS